MGLLLFLVSSGDTEVSHLSYGVGANKATAHAAWHVPKAALHARAAAGAAGAAMIVPKTSPAAE